MQNLGMNFNDKVATEQVKHTMPPSPLQKAMDARKGGGSPPKKGF